MIGVLTHHWAEKDKVENARHILDGNGEAQRKAPGFISRTTLLSKRDPTQISSLVVWESDHIYDKWKESDETCRGSVEPDPRIRKVRHTLDKVSL